MSAHAAEPAPISKSLAKPARRFRCWYTADRDQVAGGRILGRTRTLGGLASGAAASAGGRRGRRRAARIYRSARRRSQSGGNKLQSSGFRQPTPILISARGLSVLKRKTSRLRRRGGSAINLRRRPGRFRPSRGPSRQGLVCAPIPTALPPIKRRAETSPRNRALPPQAKASRPQATARIALARSSPSPLGRGEALLRIKSCLCEDCNGWRTSPSLTEFFEPTQTIGEYYVVTGRLPGPGGDRGVPGHRGRTISRPCLSPARSSHRSHVDFWSSRHCISARALDHAAVVAHGC